ncbi:6939_t:CDS:10 [Ambispora gerdemannii]|uniref:Leukotriene A(4) hydrolase n=1 Tax=Ambispora gerdemannii TaxID=144530 RepID=A0A9N9C925_9GLOM|nr:6939_t:CDS:10 [Ambispora gerdemannii]
MVYDPNSLSNISDVQTTHIHLDLSVDFSEKVLSGYVVLNFITVREDVSEIILDTRDIDVKQVLFGDKPLKSNLAPRDEKFGSALHIELPESFAENKRIQLKIVYNTSPTCTAAQWLEPSQTIGKKYPYFFTQCQAIHARSLLPCQDSPAIKLTYSANIRSPYQTLMSAMTIGEEDVGNGAKIYKFEQMTKIPSYLIALAIGNIKGKKIGPRSTVWTEPENLEASAWEFVDTEKFIATGEDMLTPYEWGKYDLLVLPPSFPYGGMENPSLTFVTPTLLAGDRSLVDVVAHEISHSWMGNLVTAVNWEHFWLNEGWTVFIERKILARLYGENERQFQAILGYSFMVDSIELFGENSPFTVLVPKLNNVDPDDCFSNIPYEKGFNFLYYIEQIVGGTQVFEPYMKAHVKQFRGKSITTDDWKDYLFKYMEENHGPEKKEALLKIDWDRWLNAPGYPPVKNEFGQTLSKACSQLAKKWDNARNNNKFEAFSPDDIKDFTSNQKVVFLQQLRDCSPFPHKAVEALDKIYNLTDVVNSEIRLPWQELCLKTEYEPIFPHVVNFITGQGRMKFVRPLYRLLNKCKNGSELAKKTFLENKSFYHPIAAALIEKDIMT